MGDPSDPATPKPGQSETHRRLTALVEQALPGAHVLGIQELGPDSESDESTTKGIGYGAPKRISVDHDGRRRDLVFHAATSNPFGHDRRSDRAAEMLLSYDTFSSIPGHVPALDVGALTADGFLSLKETGEFYLLTEYAEGRVYANDLRDLAERGEASAEDVERAVELALYLARLHELPAEPSGKERYARAIRDLLGSGEGIFGIIDGYPPDTKRKTWKHLYRIEKKCQRWRWKLRAYPDRLRRIHGDFHPFNLVFGAASARAGNEPARGLKLLDTSRGSAGDPADDVSCLAINYVFFALGAPESWKHGFSKLWDAFFATYLRESGDPELLAVAPPYLAWRALVLANPTWYPAVAEKARRRLLDFAEAALDEGALDPKRADALFD